MNSLLPILIFSIIATVSCAPELKMMEVKKLCMKESGASDEMVTNAHIGKFSSDPAMTNFFMCVGKQEGIIDNDGHVHKDVLKKKMMIFTDDEAAVDAAVEKCVVEKSTMEESVMESMKCFFTELHK
nr:odorant binding protein 12 [Pachyrhinus yasumatsui]